MSKFASCLATCAGVGKLPKMPGTYGALLALPLAWGLLQLGTEIFIIATILLIPIGIWASHVHAKTSDSQDPQEIIIDEVAGQFIALWAVAFGFAGGIIGFALAFILFRLFDIFKPFPIGFLDKNVKGGLGIMLDDIVAGFFALAVLFLLQGLL